MSVLINLAVCEKAGVLFLLSKPWRSKIMKNLLLEGYTTTPKLIQHFSSPVWRAET